MSENELPWVKVQGPPGLTLEVQASPDRPVVVGLRLTGGAVRADDLRLISLEMIAVELGFDERGTDPAILPALKREPGMSADEFSMLVSEHYRAWSARTPKAASVMAATYGVKLPTMHTWIREARLRGHLPPAPERKGPR